MPSLPMTGLAKMRIAAKILAFAKPKRRPQQTISSGRVQSQVKWTSAAAG